MQPQSLTARVLLVSTIWAVLALVVIGVVISALYRQGSERGFQDLLRAQLYNVINSISVNDTTALAGSPQLGDLRFSQPQTGWYWIVEPIGEFDTPPLMSTSLGSGTLPIASVDEVPFDIRYERFYTTADSFGNLVEVAETEVVLDIQGHTARFRVAGNRDVLEADINAFNQNLYIALAIFGLGGLGMNALAILFGLRPLDQARRSLEKVRGGESERLDGAFPREIQPLASEVNALIDSNRRIIERARMQVGNLAHSLKTPIAVLLNESRVLDAPHGDLVKAQADAMQMQVQSYLNRARIAAQRESVLARTEVEPVLERLVRVMRRLHADKTFVLSVSPPGLVLAMEQQDVEETIGNLLDNAARYAGLQVTLRAHAAPEGIQGRDPGRRQWITLEVEDDGPGLEPEQIAVAIKRGKRLDESKPGTGLGLSIVSEIAGEYQGTLGLSRGEAGGLKAMLVLPAVS
ncbi:sensor histidine kinase [Pararhizobium antarcticum]|uniref:histidine kinase n=1 Tax=Pararhizobium antarcticum TaxID=1798805 RepID=A0A657LTR1_9HYPH|nr:HAMP domain-containing sensor histidine kinase [Pararhizobium antarcticum]OJF97390.1 histidine kinase [Rhizobium sp. 58]OJF98084.1 histidine kinase [Pararhizobium antarcticum]